MQIYGNCFFLPKRFLNWIFAGKEKQGMSDGKTPQKNENSGRKGIGITAIIPFGNGGGKFLPLNVRIYGITDFFSQKREERGGSFGPVEFQVGRAEGCGGGGRFGVGFRDFGGSFPTKIPRNPKGEKRAWRDGIGPL